jgi:hypothetical protein
MATVLAYATSKQAYFDLFMASCERHAITPVLLGWGTKWIGFGHKTTESRAAIKHLPDEEIVISVDPFDVVFLSGLEEIEAKFRRAATPYLCGALKLGPLLRRIYGREFNRTGQPVPATPSGYDYLNSGTWISTAGYARQLIDRLVSECGMQPTDMDQEILTGLYIHQRAGVGIDWRCEIFDNLLFRNFLTRQPNLKDLEFRDGRVLNLATGTRPCILHASGNALMEDIARRLGYAEQCAVPTENHRNFLRKALFHILQLLGWGRWSPSLPPQSPGPPVVALSREPASETPGPTLGH